MSGVWTWIEHQDGEIKPIGLPLGMNSSQGMVLKALCFPVDNKGSRFV